MESKYTPTPYRYDCDKRIVSDVKMDGFYDHKTIALIQSCNHEEDGNFIVLACNSHEALVEALEYFYNISFDLESSKRKGYIQEAQNKAKEALQQAEGNG